MDRMDANEALSSLAIRWERLLFSLEKAAKTLAAFKDCDGDLSSSSLPSIRDFGSSLLSPRVVQHKNSLVRLVAAVCAVELCRVFGSKVVFLPLETRQTLVRLFIGQLDFRETTRDEGSVIYRRRLWELLARSGAMAICSSHGEQLLTAVFDCAGYLNQSPSLANAAVKIVIDFVKEVRPISTGFFESLARPLTLGEEANPDAENMCRRLLTEGLGNFRLLLRMYYGRQDVDEDDLRTMNKVVLRLFRSSPELFESMNSLFSSKLKSEILLERKLAVKLYVRLIAEKESTIGEENKDDIWTRVLERFLDIDPDVRGMCAKYSKYFLVYHPQLRADTEAQLRYLINDQLVGVRRIVVESIISALNEDFYSISDMLLEKVTKKIMMDFSYTICQTASEGLVRLLGAVMTSVCAQDDVYRKTDLDRMGGILSPFMRRFMVNNPQQKYDIVRLFCKFILGDNALSAAETAQRLVFVVEYLNGGDDISAFQRMISDIASWGRSLLDMCLQADDEQDISLERVAYHKFSSVLYHSHAEKHFSVFWQRLEEDESVRESVKGALTSSSSTVVTKAIDTVVEEFDRSVAKTVRVLLIRCCSRIIDAESASLFFEKVSLLIDIESDISATAMKLLTVFVEHFPSYFTTVEVAQDLPQLIEHDNELISSLALKMIRRLCRGTELSSDVSHTATKLILSGSPRQAKESICLISQGQVCSESHDIIRQILPSLLTKLQTSDDEELRSALKALRHIAELFPGDMSEEQRDTIVHFVIDLMKSEQSAGESDFEWRQKDELSHKTRAKMTGLKFLSYCVFSEGEITDLVRVVGTCLEEVATTNNVCSQSADRAWLQLRSCLAVLHLCSTEDMRFSDWCYPLYAYRTIGNIFLNEYASVKYEFLFKFFPALMQGMTRPWFTSFFVLFGIERNEKLKINAAERFACLVKEWSYKSTQELLRGNPGIKVLAYPEYSVPAAVHFLAHSEIYGEETTSLQCIRDCLWFYLEPFVDQKLHVQFILNLLKAIPSVEDATVPVGNEVEQDEADRRLCIVAEIGMNILRKKATFETDEFAGNPWLHASLFRTRRKERKAIQAQEYLKSILVRINALFSEKGQRRRRLAAKAPKTKKAKTKGEVSSAK
ncbi:sister chromatid cohesion protein PDS5 homolog B-B-like [Oscarella lobularis]|uniref:sister chromatid cohesion protein PDS5 homolog B-B-like n=1 Tax=Oscarella lobularis TaxID=121494 RepID=UPI0033143C52